MFFLYIILKYIPNLVSMFTRLDPHRSFYSEYIMSLSYGNSTKCVGWQCRVEKEKKKILQAILINILPNGQN